MEKAKKDFYIELVLFLVLGILIGVAVKMEAAKRIAIGFDDYKMGIASQDYDINKLQDEILKKQIEEAKNDEAASQETEESQEPNQPE
jgi:hypothetical protein